MLPLLAAAIITTTMSNSSTGGNVVSGNSVVTGSSYSSVSVQTYDGDTGGTSTVQIETDDNGQVNKQTITKTIPPGGSADIDIATSTGDGRADVTVHSVVNATGSAEVSDTSASNTIDLSAQGGTASFWSLWRSIVHFFGIRW